MLVPLGEGAGPETRQGWLTADHNGIRFVLAFTDEDALARYAELLGRSHEEWTYQTVLGARLLDVAVPAAGMPCGIALNCADGARGMVFPPVRGIVPDEAAIDSDHHEGELG
ncbi:SseB family protein [Streptomyces sp. NPDC059248]|uniref:SseB family protein n=1 Tax=Streptomyces sp. NPDC059248 TaxID=3346791 RepID=UPI00367C2F2D